jgi:hypothetical protein
MLHKESESIPKSDMRIKLEKEIIEEDHKQEVK